MHEHEWQHQHHNNNKNNEKEKENAHPLQNKCNIVLILRLTCNILMYFAAFEHDRHKELCKHTRARAHKGHLTPLCVCVFRALSGLYGQTVILCFPQLSHSSSHFLSFSLHAICPLFIDDI